MKELTFKVDSVVVTSKSVDGKTVFNILNDVEKDLKLLLKATFTKDVPTEWERILGRAGSEVYITISSKNQQTTLD